MSDLEDRLGIEACQALTHSQYTAIQNMNFGNLSTLEIDNVWKYVTHSEITRADIDSAYYQITMTNHVRPRDVVWNPYVCRVCVYPNFEKP